jgi:hypothetical protein
VKLEYIHIYIYNYSSLTATTGKKTIATMKVKTLMIALAVRGGFKLGSAGLVAVGATCMMIRQSQAIFVATPLWPSVGVKPNTWKSWGFGVLRDSRMFRARHKEEKHLALGCSWCRWKGLETYISKMPSHWQFGHLEPKLWAKEGPGVKLAV